MPGIDESGACYLLADNCKIRPNLTQLNLTEQCNTIRAKNCKIVCTIDTGQMNTAAYAAEDCVVRRLYERLKPDKGFEQFRCQILMPLKIIVKRQIVTQASRRSKLIMACPLKWRYH